MKEYVFEINGESYRVKVKQARADGALVEVNDRKYQVAIRTPASTAKPKAPAAAPASTASATGPAVSDTEVTDGTVNAPMPGVILKLLLQPGETVTANQPVLVLEAMKMENEIKAPVAGTLEKFFVSEGASVNTGDALFQIQP
jgi:biotin carboxyl carrier protein